MDQVPVEATMEKLDKEITCPVCFGHFEEPKILPCLHYYCKSCIKGLVTRSGTNQPFSCPECRSDTLIPENDPSLLPTAFFMNRLKELHACLEKAHGKTEVFCQLCSGGKAEGFCRQCGAFLCPRCIEAHQRMKSFIGHKVLSLDELKAGAAKNILATPPPRVCVKHNEPSKIYCFDCSRLICRDCIVIDHREHRYGFVKEATPRCKDELINGMIPLKNSQKIYCNAITVINSLIMETKEENAANSLAITTWVQESVDIVQQYGKQLLHNMSTVVEQKVADLSAQLESFELKSAVIQDLTEFCEQTLENATDEEFMEINAQVSNRVADECTKHPSDSIKIPRSSDVGVELPAKQNLLDLCRNRTQVVSLQLDLARCTLKYSQNVKVNETSCLTFYARYQNGKPCKSFQFLEGKLRSLVDGSDINIEGVQQENGVYELSYTPHIRGRHQIEITVNGERIIGSPFALFVKIPPTQLGLPVRIISGLNHPYGVVVNSSQEVLITMPGEIGVFNKDGKKLQSIKHTLKYPRGIAVDQDDNIFVSDDGHNCVFKFDRHGRQLSSTGKKGSGNAEFSYPRGVTVIGENVFVCDRNNHRIQVFNGALKFEKVLFSRDLNNLSSVRDIHSDKLGNLFVCDSGHNCIQVFDRNGKYLYFFWHQRCR